jgi:hypothetical protein
MDLRALQALCSASAGSVGCVPGQQPTLHIPPGATPPALSQAPGNAAPGSSLEDLCRLALMNNALQMQLSSLGHRASSSEGQTDVASLAAHIQGLPMSPTMIAAHRASRDNAFSIADTDAKSCSSGEDSKSRTQRGSDSGNDDVVSVMTRRRKGVECKVLITYEILAQHFHESLDVVAEKLMISKTSIKAACRRLGLAKWPYQHRGPRKSRSKNTNEAEGSSAGDSSESGRVEGSKDGSEGSKDGSEGSKDGSEAASSKDAASKDDQDDAKGSDMSDDDDSDSSTHNSDEDDEGDDEPAEDARADAREREDKEEDLKAVFHSLLSREGDARPAPAKRRRTEDADGLDLKRLHKKSQEICRAIRQVGSRPRPVPVWAARAPPGPPPPAPTLRYQPDASFPAPYKPDVHLPPRPVQTGRTSLPPHPPPSPCRAGRARISRFTEPNMR